MKQAPLWTESQIEELKKLAGTMSCSQIGKVLGRSKDAVKNKIAALELPRYAVTVREKHNPIKTVPKVQVIEESRPPLIAVYKNLSKRKFAESEINSHLEYCKQCGSPVSNWNDHFQRLGHRRMA